MSKSLKLSGTQQQLTKKQTDTQFVCKLNDMMEKFPQTVHWNDEGQNMVISDIQKMEQIILPQYFRHSNLSSFIRQLNMYNFHKLWRKQNEVVFRNSLFKKGNEKNFHFIQRKKRIKQTELVLEQFEKKNEEVLEKLKAHPHIESEVKDTIISMLQYKFTVIENLKKLKNQLDFTCRQLKDCRTKKITDIVAILKQNVLQNITDQMKFSKSIDMYVEDVFRKQIVKQENVEDKNIPEAQPYLPPIFPSNLQKQFFEFSRSQRHGFPFQPSLLFGSGREMINSYYSHPSISNGFQPFQIPNLNAQSQVKIQNFSSSDSEQQINEQCSMSYIDSAQMKQIIHDNPSNNEISQGKCQQQN